MQFTQQFTGFWFYNISGVNKSKLQKDIQYILQMPKLFNYISLFYSNKRSHYHSFTKCCHKALARLKCMFELS